MVEKGAKKFGHQHPPPFRAMLERNFFMQEVFLMGVSLETPSKLSKRAKKDRQQ